MKYEHITETWTDRVSLRLRLHELNAGFHIDTVSRLRNRIDEFTLNRFRVVFVMPKSSQAKGVWVRLKQRKNQSL